MLDAYADGEVSWEDIPFERKITHERICLLDPSASTTVDFTSDEIAEDGSESHSVLRATFHPRLSELQESETTIYQALEDFKNHPAVTPITRDAKMVEHSGHMVSEGGFNMVPQYVFDGCMLAGDTVMFCMNLGYQVRGMDFAIASGHSRICLEENGLSALRATLSKTSGNACRANALSSSALPPDPPWPLTRSPLAR